MACVGRELGSTQNLKWGHGDVMIPTVENIDGKQMVTKVRYIIYILSDKEKVAEGSVLREIDRCRQQPHVTV